MMTEGSTHEVFSSKVQHVLEGGDFVEVLLLSSPVRYRLDKHRHALRDRLKDAQKNNLMVDVLVDWECQEVLDVL